MSSSNVNSPSLGQRRCCAKEHMRERTRSSRELLMKRKRFCFQVVITLMVLMYAIYNIERWRRHPKEGESSQSYWLALITAIIGYWIPNPKMDQ